MTFSVCVKCGTTKKRPHDRCSNCQFQPVSDDDKAKSLILSLDYEIDNEYRGKTKEELQQIASEIKAGKPYEFDTQEVQSVVAYAHRVMSVLPIKLIIDGIRWLLPPIALLAVAIFLLRK
jgi:predicted ATP-dependent serine protease